MQQDQIQNRLCPQLLGTKCHYSLILNTKKGVKLFIGSDQIYCYILLYHKISNYFTAHFEMKYSVLSPKLGKCHLPQNMFLR